MNYAICGLPEQTSRDDITSLYSSSPVTMYPPIGYFTKVISPDRVFTNSSPWSLSSGPPFEPLSFNFTINGFKHIYNTNLGVSQFVASLSINSGWSNEAEKSLGISLEDSTLPYFLIMKDGMQSAKTKAFCLAASNYLADKTITFLIQPTSMSSVLSNFSPEVENAFS